MPHYLVTYHGGEMTDELEDDPGAMAAARDAFMQWMSRTGAALVDPGAPIADASTISSSGVAQGEASGPLRGWSVIEADTTEAAAELLRDHPFVARGGELQLSPPAATI
jgi:hypothetical protein